MNKKSTTQELFLPTLKSNIKSDPVFHNVFINLFQLEHEFYS
jgi:hypothetical protein